MGNSTIRRSAVKSRDAKSAAELIQPIEQLRQDVQAGRVVVQARRDSKRRATTGLQPKRRRPAKPKFSLWLHSTGQWAKKIKGRYFYFGADKDAALKEYMRVKDDREAGREPPPPDQQRLTVKKLCNTFLTFKKSQAVLGELTQRSFYDYEGACQRMSDQLGKVTPVDQLQPDHLLKYRQAMTAKGWGPARIGNEITRIRSVLKFAFENGMIDRPIRFGEFKRPKKSAFRRQRQNTGSRMFEPADLRRILDAADVHLRAMILLGINCGFGNADCGSLPIGAVDLKSSWLDFPRPKTGIERRCPLWPETVEVLHESLANRKLPKDSRHGNLCFITKYGGPWFADGVKSWPLSAEFRKLLERIDAEAIKTAKKTAKENRTKFEAPPKLRRRGISFYALRHNFQTVADELGDYIATRRVMGHADNSISDHYRERFQDERLRKVVEHVHGWLYGSTGEL